MLQLFRYYDVIAALSLGKNPITGSLTFEEEPPRRKKENTETSTDPYGCVDNVFGLAKSLWPLLHRLAQLTTINELEKNNLGNLAEATSPVHSLFSVRTVLQQRRNRISIVALELSLKEWKPALELHVVNMEHAASDTSLQSLLQNAEAHRHAALVHLYTRLLGDRPDTERVQRATRAALQRCLRVMVFGSPSGALLWPLFTVGATAITSSDREITRTVMDQLLSLQGMANIMSARTLLEEVWRIADSSGEFVQWQDVAKSKGWSVILA